MRTLTLTADGTRCCLATNKGDCFVYKVSPESPNYFEKVTQWQAHNAYVLKTLYSPDMQLLATCSSDKTVRIWNTADYSLSKNLQGHSRWVWDCVFSSASDYLVTASSDNMARLWDIKDEKSIIQYAGHHKAIVCVALNDVDYVTDAHKAASQAATSSGASSSNSRDTGMVPGGTRTTLTAQQQQTLQQQQQTQQQAQARLQQQQQRATDQANAHRQQLINAATAARPQAPQGGAQGRHGAKSPDDDSAGSSPVSSGDEVSP